MGSNPTVSANQIWWRQQPAGVHSKPLQLACSMSICSSPAGCQSAARLQDVRAPVAQLDRASDYGSEGREFESLRARFQVTLGSDPSVTFSFGAGQAGSKNDSSEKSA